jgi:hypothetical protein
MSDPERKVPHFTAEWAKVIIVERWVSLVEPENDECAE